MSLANISGALLSRKLNIPLILEYNGSEAWVAKNWGNALRYHHSAIQAEEICLRYAHTVVTVSNILEKELIARGVAPEKIVCHPNCIDPLIFNPARFHKLIAFN